MQVAESEETVGNNKIGVPADGVLQRGDCLGILSCLLIGPAQIEGVVGWIMGIEAHRRVDRFQCLCRPPCDIEPFCQRLVHICIVGREAHRLL